MKLMEFDYQLPQELIAQEPASDRDFSRLMVLIRKSSEIIHSYFRDIDSYLFPGDTLIVNESKVIPARLFAVREGTGASIEVLLLKPVAPQQWEVLVRPGKKALPGDRLIFNEGLYGDVVEKVAHGGIIIKFNRDGAYFNSIIEKIGMLPLPPYIKKQPEDPDRYQTVYAREPGSVAAPTAGLHFTPELLDKLRQKGVNIVSVLLHVGLGTFRPVQVENIEEHHMHEEYYEIPLETVKAIEHTRDIGKRIIAVGTTTTRCLESAVREGGIIKPGSGWTDIFIYPGYNFKVIDGLITNFHLPKSTLIMMISAFAGKEKIMNAYKLAVQEKYRFFSFGDAMLIL